MINRRPKLSRPASLAWLADASSLAALVALGVAVPGCDESFDGPPEIVPAQFDSSVAAGGDLRLVAIADGDPVQLTQPIQGGHVLFVGAFIRNMSQSGASLLGELRRSQASDGTPLSQPGPVLYSDERSVTVMPIAVGVKPPSSAMGWQQVAADPNDLANVPACPNPLNVDIVDNPLYLSVRYTDGKGRTATAYRLVTPRCSQPTPDGRNACVCECLAGYTVDRCVGGNPDGGVRD